MDGRAPDALVEVSRAVTGLMDRVGLSALSSGWGVALGVVGGLLLLWVLLVVALWFALPDRTTLRGLLRLLPDVLRLVSRLAADRTLPRGARVRLWLLLGYLALPFDLVPDAVPVLGFADDAVVVALVLRSVARRAGRDALERSWPGTPDGLAAVLALCRVEVRPDAPAEGRTALPGPASMPPATVPADACETPRSAQ